MQRFSGTVQRITTARRVARVGNEKRKNIFVLENLQERHPLGKTEHRRDRGYEGMKWKDLFQNWDMQRALHKTIKLRVL
jgi:hypothetical protein